MGEQPRPAHWGYEDGEVPVYGECECGQVVRIDRLDLLAEHDANCAAKPLPPRL